MRWAGLRHAAEAFGLEIVNLCVVQRCVHVGQESGVPIDVLLGYTLVIVQVLKKLLVLLLKLAMH